MGQEPGIGPAQLTCPNTDTDHSDQSVPVLSAPLLLEGRERAEGHREAGQGIFQRHQGHRGEHDCGVRIHRGRGGIQGCEHQGQQHG